MFHQVLSTCDDTGKEFAGSKKIETVVLKKIQLFIALSIKQCVLSIGNKKVNVPHP